MTTPKNVRFAHHQNPIYGTDYNGFTIAYVREGNSVKYAWSLACAPDQFSKAVGRNFATATLAKHYDVINDMAALDDSSYRSNVLRAGVLHVGEIIEEYELSDYIADNVLDAMSAFDIKHAAISNILITQVVGVVQELN